MARLWNWNRPEAFAVTVGVAIAVYFTTWFFATLLAVLWSARRSRGQTGKGADAEGPASRPPFLPIVLSTTFIAALVTAAVFYVAVLGQAGR